MILYLSGTGNTRFTAESLGNLLGQPALPLPDVSPYDFKCRDKTLIFAFPVYCWGVPPFVERFIKNIPEETVDYMSDTGTKAIMVCTCGDETGLAPEIFKKALARRGMELAAGWSVQMPNDYVLLPGFDTDAEAVEHEKLEKSIQRIKDIACNIHNGIYKEDYVTGSNAWIKSRILYPLFKRWGINTRLWHYEDACTGCGRCMRACPVQNIKMKESRPQWGTRCLSCTACYHSCPVRAVQYGRISKGKGQYLCTMNPITPQLPPNG